MFSSNKKKKKKSQNVRGIFLKFFFHQGTEHIRKKKMYETYEIIKWWDKAVPCRLSFECFVFIFCLKKNVSVSFHLFRPIIQIFYRC